MKTHILKALVVVCALGSVVRAQAEREAWVQALKNGDYPPALKELLPLGQQGNAVAQYNLGFLYAKGEGVPQDYKEAVKWYRLAAEQGDASVQNNLGVLYEYGQGVPRGIIFKRTGCSIWRVPTVRLNGTKNRDAIARKMTQDQIAETQRLAREWKPRTSR